MEHGFGQDFGRVRLHTGDAAQQSAQQLNALAYTVGHDIAFAPGTFEPATHHGRRLLAHELAHVVQQRQGAGESPGAAHEQEADEAASAVQGGASIAVRKSSAPGVPQRTPGDERPPQTIKVQTGTGEVYAAYRVEDVTRLPSEYDGATMTVRNRMESGDFRPSLCVAPCCRLPLVVASKGQEEGNVPDTLPQTTIAARSADVRRAERHA
jgi:hypothetical protein